MCLVSHNTQDDSMHRLVSPTGDCSLLWLVSWPLSPHLISSVHRYQSPSCYHLFIPKSWINSCFPFIHRLSSLKFQLCLLRKVDISKRNWGWGRGAGAGGQGGTGVKIPVRPRDCSVRLHVGESSSSPSPRTHGLAQSVFAAASAVRKTSETTELTSHSTRLKNSSPRTGLCSSSTH